MASYLESMEVAALGLALLVMASCGDKTTGPTTPSGPSMIEIHDLAGANAAVGKRVRVTGVARNAKLGAAVVAGDLVIYALAHPSWPADVAGKRVTIEGVLEREQGAPARGPNGEMRATIEGPYLVIRTAGYDVAP